MPQLEAKEYARVALIIDELAPLAEEDGLYEAANGFVLDQAERKKQYGERMFVSAKQIAWLEKLHDEFVGTAETKEPKGVDSQMNDHDMDDDIPF